MSSWFDWPSTSSTRSGNKNFTAEAREEKRQQLEKDRLDKAKRRERRKTFFQAGVSVPPSPATSRESSPIRQLIHINLPELDPVPEPEDDQISLPDIFFTDSDIFHIEITMTNFDEENKDNGADAMKNLGQIKIKWSAERPEFFFTQLETELQIFSILKQFTKRQALIRCLPEEVAIEFMHLIGLQEDKCGDKPYKVLKTALLKAYGPRPGDAFQRALNRVMVSKPSVLLKLLVSDICDNNNLQGCCCAKTVWGLFQNKIPHYLKNGLANEVLTTNSMADIMDKADNLWSANQGETQVSAVESSTPKDAAEVAAVGGGGFRGGRGQNRGNRGNRGNRRGSGRGRGGNSNQPDPRGTRHPSNPPWNSCKAHWLYSEAAWQCQSPTTCPLKDKVTPKTTSTSSTK